MIRDDIDLLNLLELYDSGMNISQISKHFHVRKATISNMLVDAGRRIRYGKLDINIEDMVSLYTGGQSIKKIAEMFGVDRRSVTQRLVDAGVTLRSHKESVRLYLSQATAEELARKTEAAHAAVRGRRQSFEELCRHSAGREAVAKIGSRIEEICRNELELRGFGTIPQKAIGPYNIDIALTEYPIAVEIFGGNWHASGDHAVRFKERVKYILDSGWHIVIIWVIRDYPLEVGAIDYIVSLAELISSGEAERCQEHMIRGDGQFHAIGYYKLHDIPVKPGPQPRDNSTGRFISRIG